MKSKGLLINAQILGLFPVTGVWGMRSTLDLKFRKFSLPMLYSWITFILRIYAKGTFVLLSSQYNVSPSTTDTSAAFLGCFFTFCTGAIFQGVAIFRTKRFLSLLQELERYDLTYSQRKKMQKRRFLTSFLIHNLIFLLGAFVFPVSLIIAFQTGAYQLDASLEDLNRKNVSNSPLEDFDRKDAPDYFWTNICKISITALVLLLTDIPSLFPIIQLNYYVKVMGHRLEEIYKAMKEVGNGHSHEDEHVKLLTFQTGMDLGPNQNSWKGLTNRYLDYVEVFARFQDFSGAHFLFLFGVQFLSCVSVIYLSVASDVFSRETYVDMTLGVIMVLGVMRIWSLCGLGQKLEKVHGLILRRLLKVDRDEILNENEKSQLDKCLRIVQLIPIHISASGYFIVRRSNILSIITALVSYIIILLQFKTSENASPQNSTNMTDELFT